MSLLRDFAELMFAQHPSLEVHKARRSACAPQARCPDAGLRTQSRLDDIYKQFTTYKVSPSVHAPSSCAHSGRAAQCAHVRRHPAERGAGQVPDGERLEERRQLGIPQGQGAPAAAVPVRMWFTVLVHYRAGEQRGAGCALCRP